MSRTSAVSLERPDHVLLFGVAACGVDDRTFDHSHARGPHSNGFMPPTERRGPNVCLADEPVKTSSSYKNKTPSLWLELISMSLTL